MTDEKRGFVEERFNADVNRLYGSIDEAISYLTEIREQYRGTNISLDEHWTGYEDMEMTFVYTREETDAEMAHRIMRAEADRKRAEEERKRKAERAKDQKEYERLAQKLGRYI